MLGRPTPSGFGGWFFSFAFLSVEALFSLFICDAGARNGHAGVLPFEVLPGKRVFAQKVAGAAQTVVMRVFGKLTRVKAGDGPFAVPDVAASVTFCFAGVFARLQMGCEGLKLLLIG